MSGPLISPPAAGPGRYAAVAAAAMTALAAALASGPAGSEDRGPASQVYADPAQICAGLTPCYASLQQAVDHAGPAPALIGVFPGVYAESVDLSGMGSAIAQAPGDLSLQALDGSGQPADSGVVVDPAAPGGPGSGAAIGTGPNAGFPGDLTLLGLAFRSPDANGLQAAVLGNVLIEDFEADGAAEIGALILTQGNITVRRGQARLNRIGLAMLGDRILVEEVAATRNLEIGIGAQATIELVASQLSASLNTTGLTLFGCNDAGITAQGVTAFDNLEDGIVLAVNPSDCDPPLEAVPASFDAARSLTGDPALLSRAGRTRGSGDDRIVAQAVSATGNGRIGLAAAAGEVVIDDLLASDNGEIGHFAQAVDYSLSQAFVTANATGAMVIADAAILEQVTFSDQFGIEPGVIQTGSGLILATVEATLSDIEASDNASAGLLMRGWPGGTPASLTLSDGRFDRNTLGVGSFELSGPLAVDLLQVAVGDNLSAGLILDELSSAAISQLEATGQPMGLSLWVHGSLELTRSDIADNQTGLVLVTEAQSDTRLRCSNFQGNQDAGLVLLQGSAADARGNYWGSAAGPTHPGNPAGSGDSINDGDNGAAGSVAFLPFLAQAATAGDCSLQGTPQAALSVPLLGAPGLWLLILLMPAVAAWTLHNRTSAQSPSRAAAPPSRL